MNVIGRIVEFAKSAWSQANGSARIGLIVSAIIFLAVVIGVGYWSAQPYYVPLTENIGAIKAAEVKERLDAAKIANQLSYAGNAVLVNQKDFSAAKVAIADIVDSENMVPSAGGIDSFLGKNIDAYSENRRIEEGLEAKLIKLKVISEASVTVTNYKKGPFVSNQEPPTASVMVKLTKNATLNRSLARSIATLVASGVERLRVENVQVFDEFGNHRAVSGGDNGFVLEDQNEERRGYENAQAEKAIRLLELLLGPGKADVRLTADIDFDQKTIDKLIYDPDQKIKSSETIDTTETRDLNSGTGGSAGGPAGTGSNLSISRANNAQGQLTKSENSQSTFIFGVEEWKEIQPPGTVKRLSISVVAELPEITPPADAGAAPTQQTPITPQQLESIVKKAVGFDEDRGDSFELLITTLAGKEDMTNWLEEETAAVSPFWMDMIKTLSLVVASIVALVIGLLLIKKIQPITIRSSQQDTWSPDRAKRISDMSNIIRDNPEMLSRIVAAWSDNVPGGEASSTNRKAA